MNIKEIARRAQVSTATVSRVINNSPLVNQNTKDRLLKIIRRYDYRPSLTAQSLVRGRSNLLTLVVPPEPNFFSAYYFRQVLCGISDSLLKRQYHLMIYQHTGYDPNTGYSPEFNSFNMDGLFLIAPLINDPLLKYLESRKKLAVLINARSKSLDCVDLNNVQAVIQVVEKLVSMGHRRIGYIGGFSTGFNAVDRLKGYRIGLQKYRIPIESRLIMNGNYTVESGYDCAQRFLAMSQPPTAIFAGNDFMAIGAMRAINESGLSVPKDISLIGFDDVDVASICQPPLTTVRQNFYEMGKIAGEILIDRVENPKAPQKSVELSGDLILRDSCIHLNGKK